MDYGGYYPDMGVAAINAAASTRRQLMAAGINTCVGVTPMIGGNEAAATARCLPLMGSARYQ